MPRRVWSSDHRDRVHLAAWREDDEATRYPSTRCMRCKPHDWGAGILAGGHSGGQQRL